MNFNGLFQIGLNQINTVRRYLAQRYDQFIALIDKKFSPKSPEEAFDGNARFALITVNYSTTYYLKLMLLTLCEQQNLKKISEIVIVDNNSRDGGIDFLRKLTDSVSCINLAENKWFCHHARGLRIGIDVLSEFEKDKKAADKSNVLMFCDTDIVFRNPNTLNELATVFDDKNAVLAGEMRYSEKTSPQAQASFICVRRDTYARKDVKPIVYHGSPAYWMQKSIWKTGEYVHDFRSNFGGYILHRGRSGVSAAKKHHALSTFNTVKKNQPHFMGIENGQQIWQEIELKYTDLLNDNNQKEYMDYLMKKLN